MAFFFRFKRKYEDPIFPTHKILGFKKSINCNIEKGEQKWLQNGG
jgi:hypothetical protein